jgi:hypothetical protein
VLLFMCLYLISSNVPNASVALKGIGVECFPFYLDEETALFAFPSMVPMLDRHVAVSRFDKKPEWMLEDFRTFARVSFHYPQWSIVNVEGYHYERDWDEYSEVLWTQALGFKHFGVAYSVGYRNFPELNEHEQILAVFKVNFCASNNKLLITAGGSYSRIKPEFGDIHWVLGPVIEARYSISPFVFFLSSRHPEDFVELDSLPLLHFNYMYADYRYLYIPFEGGAALVQELGKAGTVVIGVRIRMRYIKQSDEIRTSTMYPQNYMFVSGLNYKITSNITLRAGFVLDYFIDHHRTREMFYFPSMGGSLRLGEKFVFDFATKNLSVPLNYDAAVKWVF